MAWLNGTKQELLVCLKPQAINLCRSKKEIKLNLIATIKKKKDILPGIIGYNDTVISQIENAIISGQDITLLGERGQA